MWHVCPARANRVVCYVSSRVGTVHARGVPDVAVASCRPRAADGLPKCPEGRQESGCGGGGDLSNVLANQVWHGQSVQISIMSTYSHIDI